MTIVQLSQYGFSSDPFPLVPGARVTNWAGMPDVKQLLNDVTRSVLITDVGLSEFVILHGDFGSGKSHALRYFNTLINDVEKDYFRSKSVYIKTMRLDQKVSFLRLYREVIETLGFNFLSNLGSQIQKMLNDAEGKMRDSIGRDELIELVKNPTLLLQRLLDDNVPEEEHAMVRLLIRMAEGNKEPKQFLLGEKKGIPEIGYPNPIDSDFMATKVLGSLFRSMCLSIGDMEGACRGAFLFVDEVESIIELKALEQQMLFQAFRELLNELPYNFCMLWSFTGDAALLEAVIPRALMTRLTRNYIELQSMEVDEAKEFLKSQFLQFRPVGFENSNPFHPFQETTIELVLEHIIEMIPRQMFRTLRIVLERSIRRHGLEPGEEIEPSLAEEILRQSGL